MNQYSQMPYGQQYPYGQQQPYGQQMQPTAYPMQDVMGQQQMSPMGYPMQGMMGAQQMPIHGAQAGTQDWPDFCKRYMHHFVNMQTTDGQQHEGIIEGTDQENVYMLIPDGDTPDGGNAPVQRYESDEDAELEELNRYGAWHPGFGYGYGRYPRRFRRFRRRRFPFFTIGGFYFPFFF